MRQTLRQTRVAAILSTLNLLGLALLAGCAPVMRSSGPAPRASTPYSTLAQIPRGGGPWIGHPPKQWAMRWSGVEGAITTQWQTMARWPTADAMGEPLVWVGLSAQGCGGAPGTVGLLTSPMGDPQGVPTVATRERGLWAASWLAAMGWAQAWRPVWVVEYAPEGELAVQWESPPSPTVAEAQASPCLVGWVGLPARAYWINQGPEAYRGELDMPLTRASSP